MRNFFNISIGCAAILAPAPAFSQASGSGDERDREVNIASANIIPDDQITVLANGFDTAIGNSGKSVTVINRQEIESIQGPDIVRVLERVPGVSINRNGGVGATTSVRIRGSDNDQVLTLIDGVRVADPSSIGNGYDLTNLLPGNVDRIEVLRGSNSTIWGSSAVGGVILVNTAQNETGGRFSAEYGSRDSVYLNGSASLAGARFGVTAYGSYFDTDGFSALASGTEKDGFEQAAGGVNAYFRLTDELTLRAGGRYSDGTVEIDNFGDTNDTQDTEQYSVNASLDYQADGLGVIATYSAADTHRLSTSSFGPFIGDGHLDRGDIRAEIEIVQAVTLYTGGYYEWSDYTTNYGGDAEMERRGGYAQLGYSNDIVSIAGGVRIDDGTRFGSEVSFGADASFALSDNMRLHGSYGEGYRAPSLYQLYDGFSGNLALKPEDSRNYDAGLEVGTKGGTFLFDLTVFQRDIENQIEFDSSSFVYFNTESVRARGVEMEATLRPTSNLQVLAAYTILGTELRSGVNAGNQQGRRPGQTLTLSVDWDSPFAGLKLGGDLRAVSDSFDRNDNVQRLGAYEVVTLRAAMPINGRFELFGRAENVFDTQYQTARGYNTAGRGWFAGVRAAL